MKARMILRPEHVLGRQVFNQYKSFVLMRVRNNFKNAFRAVSTSSLNDDYFSQPNKPTLRHDPNLILDEDTSAYYSTRDETLRYLMGMCRKLVVYSATALVMIMLVGTESFEDKAAYLKRELTLEKYAPTNLVKYQHEKVIRIYNYRESRRLNHIEKMKKRLERRERVRLWKRKWKYNLGLLRKRPDAIKKDSIDNSLGYIAG